MTRPRPRAILLDLDDTILDDTSGVQSSWRSVCELAARDVSELDPDALLKAIGRVRDWYWSDPERHRVGRADLRSASRRIVQEALHSLGIKHPDLAATIADTYRDLRDAAIRPLPRAVETLVDLRSRNLRLGLITNGAAAAQRAKIERFDLARHFDHILIEGEFGAGKPEEHVYRAAMVALRSEPGNTWIVGDNLEWEVEAPQQLGLYAVWVDAKGHGVPNGVTTRPHHIICALSELPQLLDFE